MGKASEELLQLLLYRREQLAQFLVAATIFGAFSIGGAIAILASTQKQTVYRYLLLMLSLASLLYIFATSIDVVLLVILKNDKQLIQTGRLGAVLEYVHWVTWSVIAGTFCLWAAIAGFGFAFSRRLGFTILVLSCVTLAGFLVICFKLNSLLK